MLEKTTTELFEENLNLRMRLEALETRLSKRFPGKVTRFLQPKIQRKREETLRLASESRYRRLFETAKDGILILTADEGQIIDVNPFLIKLLGYSREELMGKHLWELGLFKDIATSKAAFGELQAKQYIRYEELPLETKNGDQVEVEFVSNVYRVNAKKVIQCNIRDISERKQSRERIHKANQELSALVGELQTHDREMRLINDMNDLLQTCKTKEEAYLVIERASGELFGGQSGGLAILQPSGNFLETVARWGSDPLMDAIFSLDDCWGMRRGKVHEIEHPASEMVCTHFIRLPQTGYRCIPLVVQGETLGLFYTDSPPELSAEGLASRARLAATVSEAIKLSLSNLMLREVLRDRATRDALTGLFNRRYLMETLPRELNRALRRNNPVAVAMLDIDHFKYFNDTFGHEAGDLILRELGGVLQGSLRQSDIVCRYGGEEFVLVLPEAPQDATWQQMEKIRLKVKALQIRYGTQLLGTVSVSIGIAMSPEHGQKAKDLIGAADKAMYAAKNAGRDCIVVYQKEALETE